MKTISITNVLIYLAVMFFPLQFLAIRFFTGAYDITSLLFISNILLVLISGLYMNKKILIIISLFIILQCLTVIYFNIGPYYRFISGIIWLSSLVLILINGNFLHDYSQKIVTQIIIILVTISAVYMWIEYYFIITPEIYAQYIEGRPTKFYLLRPKAGFSEPSYAALALFSASAASIATIILAKMQRKYLISYSAYALLFLSAAFLARSMHVATFILGTGIVVSLWLSFRVSLIKITVFFVILLSLIILAYTLLSYSHYYDRVNIFVDPLAMTNPSLLSWLRGFDQVLAVMKSSPILGYGIGSTGYFEFDSLYGERLAYYRIYDLTLKDAFSLLWRLLIEIGLLPVLLFLCFILYKINQFRNYIINTESNGKIFNYIVFNFTFALSLIIGCLIKEPNYARSTLFLGIFLISTIPLNYNDKNTSK